MFYLGLILWRFIFDGIWEILEHYATNEKKKYEYAGTQVFFLVLKIP